MKKHAALLGIATGLLVFGLAFWVTGLLSSVRFSAQVAPAPSVPPTLSPSADSDGDGLTNAQEAKLQTSPTKADTDGDGRNDGIELLLDLNPNSIAADAGVPKILSDGPDSLLIKDKDGQTKVIMKDFAALMKSDSEWNGEKGEAGAIDATVSFVPNQLLVKLEPSGTLGGSVLTSAAGEDKLEAILEDVVDVTSIETAFPPLKPAAPSSSPAAYQLKVTEDKADLDLIYEVKVAPNTDIEQVAQELQGRPGIDWAQPNFILTAAMTTNDPYFGSSGAFGQTYRDMWGLPAINADKAWDLTRGKTAAGKPIIVAVVDSGVDYTHTDLAQNIWTNPGEIAGDGIDNDANGFIDDVRGWDFAGKDADPMDKHGHGTHVAGTIAAVGNNSLGIVGVAFESKIMPLKGLNDEGSGSSDDLALAIIYAVKNGAKVINMSFGGNTGGMANPVLESALKYADDNGVVPVAAGGNDKIDARNASPVNAGLSIGVGADTPLNRRASFSNFGKKIDVSAPGGGGGSVLPSGDESTFDVRNIISTMSPGYLSGLLPSLLVSSGFYRLAGTSMATPHVAGVVALYLAYHPEVMQGDPTQVMAKVRKLMRVTSTPLPNAWPPIGTGRVDAYKMLTATGTPPVAQLDNLDGTVIGGKVSIMGSAWGQPFDSFTLRVREDGATTWQTLVDKNPAPKSEDVLFADWDTTDLPSGVYTLWLTAQNTNGMHEEDTAQVFIRSFKLSRPFNNDVFRLGNIMDVKGTVQGTFDSYAIEYAKGFEPAPSQWVTAGVTLQGNGTQQVVDGLLGRWDTSKILPYAGGYYTLRLVVKRTGKTDVVIPASMIYLEPNIEPGDWPANIPTGTGYQFSHEEQIWDFEGDGEPELVSMGTHNLAIYVAGTLTAVRPTLYVFNGNGSLRAKQFVDGGESQDYVVPTKPMLVNWGPNKKKVIFTEQQHSCWSQGSGNRVCKFFLFDENLLPVPGWPKDIDGTPFGGWMRKVVVDVNGDGIDEIAFFPVGPAWGMGDGVIVNVLYKDGTVKTLGRVEQCVRGHAAPPNPVAGNFYGTRMQFALPMGRDCDMVTLMNLDDGSIVPGWPRKLSGIDYASLAAANLVGDSHLELVAYSTNVPVSIPAPTPEQKGGSIHVFTGDGNFAPGWPQPKKVNSTDTIFGHQWATFADLNGDGRDEMVTTFHFGLSQDDCGIRIYYGNGTEAAGSPLRTGTEKFCDDFPGHFPTRPAVAMIKGKPVIFAAGEGQNYYTVKYGKTEKSGGLWAWTPNDASLTAFTRLDWNGPLLEGDAVKIEGPGAAMTAVKTREGPIPYTNPVTGVTTVFMATQDDGDKFRGLKGRDSFFRVRAPDLGAAVSTCGDGIKAGQEACDDGDTESEDGCSSACVVEAGYTCTTGVPNVCTKIAGCGNGLLETGEFCDDGNKVSADGCSASCGIENGFACMNRVTPPFNPQSACWTCQSPLPAAVQAPIQDRGFFKQKQVLNLSFTDPADTALLQKGPFQFILIPQSASISHGAALSAVVSPGAKVYGYKYSDLNASAELAARAAGETLISKLFPGPGEFFVSDEMRAANPAFFTSFETTHGVTFKPLTKVALSRNARYMMVADDTTTTIKVRNLMCTQGIPLPFGGNNCGNGIVDTGETCDDGNKVSGDGCSVCKIDAGFSCTGAPSVCTPNAPVCGDGVKAPTEACDDGNQNATDGCTNACAIQTGWTCTGSPSVCTQIPSGPVCGDGVRVSPEQCDDGNTVAGDGCSGTCTLQAGYTCTTATPNVCTTVCGDGIKAGQETCDDGNTTANDGCSATCTVQSGYSCTTATPNVCTTVCGDGIKAGQEACDDGNQNNTDGCSTACAVQSGWTCTGSPSVCTPVSQGPSCGDGVPVSPEQCDDGGTIAGDGCSAICKIEGSCYDSDGQDITRIGWASDTSGAQLMTDSCGQPGFAVERVCDGGVVQSYQYLCAANTVCSQGICVPNGLPPVATGCIESDNGFKITVPGNISTNAPGQAPSVDSCVQIGTVLYLRENYCQTGTNYYNQRDVRCPPGTTCKDGPNGAACLP